MEGVDGNVVGLFAVLSSQAGYAVKQLRDGTDDPEKKASLGRNCGVLIAVLSEWSQIRKNPKSGTIQARVNRLLLDAKSRANMRIMNRGNIATSAARALSLESRPGSDNRNRMICLFESIAEMAGKEVEQLLLSPEEAAFGNGGT